MTDGLRWGYDIAGDFFVGLPGRESLRINGTTGVVRVNGQLVIRTKLGDRLYGDPPAPGTEGEFVSIEGTAGNIIEAASITAGDSLTRTFAFTVPIGRLFTASIDEVQQSPADCAVIGGALVFAGSVPAPAPGQVVSAQYTAA